MRILSTNEITETSGGFLGLIFGAIDAYRDNKAIEKANALCGSNGVQSVSTQGLTGTVITCKPGG